MKPDRVQKSHAAKTEWAEKGATFIEFALVLPLILFFVIMLIDMARYFTTTVILSHAAELGLQTAQCAEDLEYDPDLSDETRYREMHERRKKIAMEATAFPRTVLGWTAGEGGDAAFTKFRHVTTRRDLTDHTEALDILLLLPGESAVQLDPGEADSPLGKKPDFSELNWVDHLDLCARDSPTCIKKRQDSRTEPEFFIGNLLRNYPIVVEIHTRFHFLLPSIPSIPLKGIAVGYRERAAQMPM